MSPIKTKPSTKDMGLYVPSRVLAAIAAASTTLDTTCQPESPCAADVIIKMSEVISALTLSRDVVTHDLTKLKDKAVKLERLKCAQTLTAKLDSINKLFARLHGGESPISIASEFTELTDIQF